MSSVNRLYTDYDEAEDDCDMIAGDNDLHMAVVERFDLEGPGEFMACVLNITEARAMVAEKGDDAEIIYDNDRSPETQARWS